jgi:hypothetical protein
LSRLEASEERSEASSRSAGVRHGRSSPAIWSFAAFVSIIVANTLWETVLQSEVPPDVLSRVSSYDWAISLVFMPIGFALWGPISELVGVDTAFVAAALVSAAAKVGPVAVREVRDLRRADAAPPRARQATT